MCGSFSVRDKYNKLYSLMKDTLRDNMWYEDSLTDYRKVMRYINEAEYSYKGIGDYMTSIRKRKDVEVIVKGDEGVNDLINVLKGLGTFSTRRKELVLRLYTDENDDEKVKAIDKEEVFMADERIDLVAKHILSVNNKTAENNL